MEYVVLLMAIVVYALRIAIPIFVARVMWKKDYRKWQIAIGFIVAIFIPWLGLIYLVFSRFTSPGISLK